MAASSSQTRHGRHSRKRRRRQRLLVVLIVIILVVIISAVAFAVQRYRPSDVTSDYTEFYNLSSDDAVIINYDHEVLDVTGRYADGEVYLPYSWFHNTLNARFYWDSDEQILRYVLPEGIVETGVDTTEYTLDREPYAWNVPIVRVYDGDMYLSLTFLNQYTDLSAAVYGDPYRVVLSDEWGEQTLTVVKNNTEVRELGGVKSNILSSVSKDELVTVLEEMDDWTKVCTEDGFVGYIRNRMLGSAETRTLNHTYEEPEYPHRQKDGTINMAWHQTTSQAANNLISSVLASTSGINVISPTWFYLNDDAGGIASLASADYVTYCHQNGIEVWALISNLENPNVDTTYVLNHTSTRDALIDNLMSEALRYNLDGINIDFESLEGEAGVGFLEFIRELSLRCAENNLVLSVDNYPPSSYTAFYSRAEQAVFADYIVLMAYDEHYNGSDAGSVASIGFVRESVADTLTEVPADQLILGIPFYTRLWKLTQGMEGEVVSSEALGMTEAENRVLSSGGSFAWLEEAGQYYASYDADGYTYEIWLEDETSIDLKLSVMQENGLAGCSFWKLNYEKSAIWDTVANYMQ